MSKSNLGSWSEWEGGQRHHNTDLIDFTSAVDQWALWVIAGLGRRVFLSLSCSCCTLYHFSLGLEVSGSCFVFSFYVTKLWDASYRLAVKKCTSLGSPTLQVCNTCGKWGLSAWEESKTASGCAECQLWFTNTCLCPLGNTAAFLTTLMNCPCH